MQRQMKQQTITAREHKFERTGLHMVEMKESSGSKAKLRMKALPTTRASSDMTIAVVVVAVAMIQRKSILSVWGAVSALAKDAK